MDKELILEAVKAVIEFNNRFDAVEHTASIQIGGVSNWLYITKGASFKYIYSKHGVTNKDLQYFINKLKELGEK